MRLCFDVAGRRGRLIRHQGGRWFAPGEVYGMNSRWFKTATIKALVKRGLLREGEMRVCQFGSYYTEAFPNT